MFSRKVSVCPLASKAKRLLTFFPYCPILDISPYQGEVKCPAEENENCEKSPLTNARKNCGKTDTRTNRGTFEDPNGVFRVSP
jgi:hypothetical protein